MATNSGEGRRVGAVTNRYQKETSEGWVKYDAGTDKAIALKQTPGPFKGVRKVGDK